MYKSYFYFLLIIQAYNNIGLVSINKYDAKRLKVKFLTMFVKSGKAWFDKMDKTFPLVTIIALY